MAGPAAALAVAEESVAGPAAGRAESAGRAARRLEAARRSQARWPPGHHLATSPSATAHCDRTAGRIAVPARLEQPPAARSVARATPSCAPSLGLEESGEGDKQGATLPVKWRSLAGLLPGGGLKAAPPLDPPRPSIISPFHPPGQVPRIARGTLESGVVLGEAWSARYGVGLRPSFYSGSLGESLLVLLHGKPLGEALV